MRKVSFLQLLEAESPRELLEGHWEEAHGVNDLDSIAAQADDFSPIADHLWSHSLLLQVVQDELAIKALGIVSHDQGTSIAGMEEPLAEVLESVGALEDLLLVFSTAGAVAKGRVAAVEADLLSHTEVHLNKINHI